MKTKVLNFFSSIKNFSKPKNIFIGVIIFLSVFSFFLNPNSVFAISLRDTGPGGGLIFYIAPDGMSGLEAAPADPQSTGILWAITAYKSTSVTGTSTAIGTGLANTNLIIAQNGAGSTYAAGLARAYTNNGKSDWFLPSKDELNKMYINLKKGTDEYGATYTSVGGFNAVDYWSSSEYSAINAWYQQFYSTNQTNLGKGYSLHVRAARVFYNCSSPWGIVGDGYSNTAYASSAPAGACSGETRTCSGGSLSGSYTATSCTAGCASTPWGAVSNGYSNTAYSTSTVPYGSSCASQVRTCSAGTLDGSYGYTSCVVNANIAPPISTPSSPGNGATVSGNGSNITFTTNAVSDAEGQTVQYYFRIASGSDGETGAVCNSGWQTSTSYVCNPGVGTFYWHVYTYDGVTQTNPNYTWSFYNNYQPYGVSVSPTSGSFKAGAQTFTSVYRDPNGGGDINYVHLLINYGVDGNSTAFYGYYVRSSNSCYIFNSDNGGAWATQGWGGAPSSLPFVTLTSCSSSVSGTDLTVTWNLNFTNWNESGMNEYLYVVDNSSWAWGWSGSYGAINVNTYSTYTFDGNGATGGPSPASVYQNYGTSISAPSSPTRTGYTFTGWSPAIPATMPVNGGTSYAQWGVNSYTISFDSAGGSAVTAITQAYGSAVSAPAAPTRTGYTFTGWSPGVPAAMPAGSQTLTATWSINAYTYTFDGNGATGAASPSSVYQNYGSGIATPGAPTRTGYTFTGWSPTIPSTMPLNGGTSVAQWTLNTPTLVSGVVNTSPVAANGVSQYTVTTVAGTIDGGADITDELAIINMGGSNAGSYRGYLQFSLGGGFIHMGGNFRQASMACSGGGYAGTYNGYGSEYINLVSCSTSVSGNNRTVNYVINFNTNFTSPVTSNNVTTYATNSRGVSVGWTAQSNFDLLQPAYKSCRAILTAGASTGDGVYWIDTDGVGGNGPTQVYCDMTRDGGGWTLMVKSWYQAGVMGQTGAVGAVADATSHKGNGYKLSDTDIRNIIGPTQTFDVMADQNGWNSAYSSGNYEYDILRDYKAYWTFGSAVAASSTPTIMQSYRLSDNALAWTGNLTCGNGGAGINCYDVDYLKGTNPQGGAGCDISMGYQSNPGWHHFYMSETNTDTYLYMCNGPQHSSSYDMNHRWWVRESGLVGHWNFDEGSGSTATDISGYGNNETVYGANWTTGKLNGALNFNVGGGRQYAQASPVNINTTLTLSAWINPTSYPSEMGTIIVGGGAYYLSLYADGSLNSYWYGTSPEGYHSSGAGTVPLNTWSHVVSVWNGSNVKLYVNGVLKNTISVTGSGNNASSVVIGAESTGRQFGGSIDEVRIYNRAISPGEVMGLYRSMANTLVYTAGANGTLSGTTSQTIAYGSTGSAVTAVPNTGYSFVNWSDGSTANPRTDTTAKTVTANFSVNSYTITFDSAGGTAVGAITQNYGISISAPASPTKTGYTFAGWSPAVPVTMGLSQTITATWNIISYSITFNSAGGTTVTTITQNYGTAISAPAAPTKTGYTFAGWSPAIATTMPVGGQSLTATWTANNYTITFDSAGGTAVTAITQAYASAVTAPAAPTKTGYTFAGWSPTVPTTMGLSQTLTAQWTINNFTLTYVAGANGTLSGTASQSISYGSNGTAVTAVPNSGYYFVNWSDSSTQNPRTDTNISGAISVTANFAISYLSCRDILNRGASTGSGVYRIDSDNVGGNDAFQVYCDMTTDGGGWTLAMKINGSQSTFDYDSAYWTNATTYQPNSTGYDTTEAKFLSYSTMNFTQTMVQMRDYTNSGDDIDKMIINQTATSLQSLISAGSYTSTVNDRGEWTSLMDNTASLQPNCNQQGFNLGITYVNTRIGIAGNNENDCSSSDSLLGFGVREVNHPWGNYPSVGGGTAGATTTAYGWVFIRDISVVSTPVASPAAGSYLTSKSITLSSDAGTTIYYTTNGTVPTTGSTLYSGAININATTTIKAIAIKSGYGTSSVMSATYDINYPLTYTAGANGTISGTASQSIPYGGSGSAVTAVPNTGYSFVNWSDASTSNPRTDTNVTGAISVTANFVPISYSITFNSAGGTTVTTITQNYGTAISAPAAPTKTGYTFAGWSPAIAATMPVGGQSLAATWTANNYTITFDSAGGTAVTAITQAYASAVTAPAAPTKTGYTFAGWSPAVPTTMGLSQTLTATWTINAYTVSTSVGANGSVSPTSVSVNYGGTTTFTIIPNAGYTASASGCGGSLVGDTFTTGVITGTCTVTASFAINTFTLNYSAGAGGTISGTATQNINYGANATAVTAIPNTGYHFVSWSDGGLHSFVRGTSTFTPPAGISSVEALVVAGGGGGGSSATSSGGGGGGGAGGLRYSPSVSVSGPVTVTVGTGGSAGGIGLNQGGSDGASSSFGSISTTGGGGGAPTFTAGHAGGSGGGGGYNGYSVIKYGGSGVAGEGNSGGNTALLSWAGGAGGGGAGGVGQDNQINHAGGLGGPGVSNSINGSVIIYSRGGGGGTSTSAFSPSNTGQGGDAAYAAATAYDGGSGIVIIRYPIATATRTDTSVTTSRTLTATFAINTYAVTYTAGANGTLIGTASQTINHGSNATAVTAVPNTGYHFTSWSDGILTATRTDTNITTILSVTANFAINTYAVTYLAGANGSILGTPSQIINYGASSVAVTASPYSNYHFVNWSDGSTANPRTDTNVTAIISVTANFAINTYLVSTSANAGGTVTPAFQTVNHGSTTTFTITPNANYIVVVTGCGGTLVGTTYTTAAITVICTVTVTFTQIVVPTVTTQTVTAITINSAVGNGNITSAGNSTITKRAFVYDIVSRALPGNVAPTSSLYSFSTGEETNGLSIGPFTGNLTGLSSGTTYYVRAYAYNSIGYSYGGEVSFTTDAYPVITQSAFRIFSNVNTNDVGNALSSQNIVPTLSNSGDSFRLRLLLHVATSTLPLNGGNFKLQYALKSGTCDSGFVGETYADITKDTPVAFYDNFNPNDKVVLLNNVGDPTHNADVIVNQSYVESNPFSNSIAAVLVGQDAKWDFSLYDKSAMNSNGYCMRVVKSDGSLLGGYAVIPEFTTAVYKSRGGGGGSMNLESVTAPSAPVTGGSGGNDHAGGGQGDYLSKCNDGIDNDSDGLIDAADPGCHAGGMLQGQYDPAHDSESVPPAAPAGTGGGTGGGGGGGDLGYIFEKTIKSLLHLSVFSFNNISGLNYNFIN